MRVQGPVGSLDTRLGWGAEMTANLLGRLVAGTLLISMLASASAQEGPSNAAQFKTIDIDRFVATRKRLSPTGMDVFEKFEGFHFQGEFEVAPFKWPRGEANLNVALRLRGVQSKDTSYGLLVRSKSGARILFHLQDGTAESILKAIQDDPRCCDVIKVWARYIYNSHGEHGLVAVWVVTEPSP